MNLRPLAVVLKRLTRKRIQLLRDSLEPTKYWLVFCDMNGRAKKCIPASIDAYIERREADKERA